MNTDEFTPLGALKLVDAIKRAHTALLGARFIAPLSEDQKRDIATMRSLASATRLSAVQNEGLEAGVRAWTDATREMRRLEYLQAASQSQYQEVASTIRKYFYAGHLRAYIMQRGSLGEKAVPSRCWADDVFFRTALVSNSARFCDGGMGDDYSGRLFVQAKELEAFLAVAMNEAWCSELWSVETASETAIRSGPASAKEASVKVGAMPANGRAAAPSPKKIGAPPRAQKKITEFVAIQQANGRTVDVLTNEEIAAGAGVSEDSVTRWRRSVEP